MIKILSAVIGLLFLAGCAESVPQGGKPPRILLMGDSMLAWNGSSQNAVSHVIERQLGEQVIDRSVVGAHVIYELPISGALGLNISKQYIAGNWDWIVMNGGGNDLWLGCGCGQCDRRMGRMLSADGRSGDIARFVAQLRASGAKVVYLGYLRTPGRGSPIDSCKSVGNAFDARLQRMAARDPGVFFVSNKDLVPHRDLSFHAPDRIHPSAKGSAAIGVRAASIIQRNDR
ncbi:MAG: SGNH/GDSL hydrolase family protein [Paracoccaceae bacterium]